MPRGSRFVQPRPSSPSFASHHTQSNDMDRVFSVDEISDHFWPSPPIPVSAADEASKMSRSASEWAFQRFLQEASAPSPPSPSSAATAAPAAPSDVVLVEIDDHPKPAPAPPLNAAVLPNTPAPVPLDSDEYQAFLKSKLNLACAAVAMTRVIIFFLTFLPRPMSAPLRLCESNDSISSDLDLFCVLTFLRLRLIVLHAFFVYLFALWGLLIHLGANATISYF